VSKVRKAIIPAAGFGLRFLPATKAQPKAMLPLVDKPQIQYVVEEALQSGIEQFIIITGRGKQAIENHFDVSYELEDLLRKKGKEPYLSVVQDISHMLEHVAYVRQKEALGLGHSILQARFLVGDEPFAVLLPDDIIENDPPCLKQMIDVHERYQCSVVAVQEVPRDDISSYGVIEPRLIEERINQVLAMVEKPPADKAPSNLAIIGRYILTPEIFEVLEKTTPGKGGEIQLTDAMATLLRKQAFYGYQFQGIRYDAGDKIGFLKATIEMALKRSDIGPELRDYLKTLAL
jgi:UTP--glucose-1-phosphate uridylyltransferase